MAVTITLSKYNLALFHTQENRVLGISMSIYYGQKIPSADFEIQENYSLIVSCCGWIA
jgi:hypothetical protein